MKKILIFITFLFLSTFVIGAETTKNAATTNKTPANSEIQQLQQKIDQDMQQLKADRDKMEQDLIQLRDDRLKLMKLQQGADTKQPVAPVIKTYP